MMAEEVTGKEIEVRSQSEKDEEKRLEIERQGQRINLVV